MLRQEASFRRFSFVRDFLSLVNDITTLRGGFPSDVLTNLQSSVFGNHNTPDCVSGVNQPPSIGVYEYLKKAAFPVPGAEPRNVNGEPLQIYGNWAVARGPDSVNTNFSVFKNIIFSERVNAQLRFEFFNLTNAPTFFLGFPVPTGIVRVMRQLRRWHSGQRYGNRTENQVWSKAGVLKLVSPMNHRERACWLEIERGSWNTLGEEWYCRDEQQKGATRCLTTE